MNKKDLGKKITTMQHGNSLWIKIFDKGATVRVKGQEELILDESDAGRIALDLRKFSYPKMYTEPQLSAIKKKFPKNKEVCAFVDRVLKDDLTYEEIK